MKKGREGVLGKVSLCMEENRSRDFPKSWSPEFSPWQPDGEGAGVVPEEDLGPE